MAPVRAGELMLRMRWRVLVDETFREKRRQRGSAAEGAWEQDERRVAWGANAGAGVLGQSEERVRRCDLRKGD